MGKKQSPPSKGKPLEQNSFKAATPENYSHSKGKVPHGKIKKSIRYVCKKIHDYDGEDGWDNNGCAEGFEEVGKSSDMFCCKPRPKPEAEEIN